MDSTWQQHWQVQRAKRTYVLLAPPFPEVGDEITISGESGWLVKRTKDASDAIEIVFPKAEVKP